MVIKKTANNPIKTFNSTAVKKNIIILIIIVIAVPFINPWINSFSKFLNSFLTYEITTIIKNKIANLKSVRWQL